MIIYGHPDENKTKKGKTKKGHPLFPLENLWVSYSLSILFPVFLLAVRTSAVDDF